LLAINGKPQERIQLIRSFLLPGPDPDNAICLIFEANEIKSFSEWRSPGRPER
jgi:hypothetical protein